MAEQVMDARSSAAFLRQRWRSITLMSMVGAVLGALYVLLVPAQLSSTALVLFPAASGASDTGQEPVTDTQVHIVASTPVFATAGKSVRPVLSATQVKQRVKVDAKTSNLIEIQAFARNARQAQSLAQAVAQAYIATLKNNASRINAVPPEFSDREAALSGQLKDVRAEIAAAAERLRTEDPTSSRGIKDAQLRARLVDDQTNLLVRLDKVEEAAAQVSGGALQIPDIIQPASPATGPSVTRRLVTWALAGALAAAACTALVLVIRRRRDPRVRARDDLADSVGSSLLAVVRGHPQRSVAGWLTFFETYEAPAEEAWAFRQVLRALVGPPSDSRDPARADSTKQGPGRVEHPHSLSVIALSGDPRAVAVAPQLAVFAASLGITTRLIVATRHDSVAALRAACATDRGSQLRAGLVVDAGGDDDEVAPAPDPSPRPTADAPARPQNGKGNPEARPRGATREAKAMPTRRAVDLTIAFTVADRREPTLDGLPATATTMLAISPGLATREELARLAVAVDDAGHRIDGVVVADRDPADRTTGRRTLDQRAVQAPLPMRMTGPSQVSMPATGRSPAR